ncbi:MAG: FliH/SctL family protein [Acidobacteriota bacterium]
MSSRLFSDGDVDASPIRWRATGRHPVAAQPPPQSHPAPDPRPSIRRVAESDRDFETEIQARVQAAFQRGVAEGDATGAQRVSAQMTPVLKNFSAITHELATVRERARRDAEQAVVQLAIAIARRVVRRDIATDPEAILGLVRAGIDKVNAREIHVLRLSPGDAEFVRQNRQQLELPASVDIQADSGLGPGGAVFETTRGELDASAQSQLDEIERGFADVIARRGR